jgi:hypothetical protein
MFIAFLVVFGIGVAVGIGIGRQRTIRDISEMERAKMSNALQVHRRRRK